MSEYHAAIHACAERYRDMQLGNGASCDDPLWKFTHELMFGCRDGFPIMKLNRWLGYIQGVLIERGLTTVQAERDWSRPIFRPLDFPSKAAT
ncbi:MAG: hypothetical protein E5V40_05805 [Mesorhizobium sp.]|nr:MAG: hypothetical protein E5V40_05805 [Mesorhizobium sp.]